MIFKKRELVKATGFEPYGNQLHFGILFTPRDRKVIDLAAIFIYILRHLFTYQSINLGLFTSRVRLGEDYPQYLLTFYFICLHIRG